MLPLPILLRSESLSLSFPRTVTLAPNEAQSVKVQLIKSNELLPGEYRSHLFFKSVPNVGALGSEQPATAKDSGISVSLKPVFGISIATIIRVGATNVTSSISNAKLIAVQPGADPIINFNLNRSGNISLYGDIHVRHIAPDSKSTEVSVMRGLAVYTPNAFRSIQLSLSRKASVDYSKGKLLIEFVDLATPNTVLSSSELSL